MQRANTITSQKSTPFGKHEDLSLKSSTNVKRYLSNKACSSPCRRVPSFTSWTMQGRRFVRMVTFPVTSAVSLKWIPLLLTSSLCHHHFVILEKPTAWKLCGGRNGNWKTLEYQSCEIRESCLPAFWKPAMGHSQSHQGSWAAFGLGDLQAGFAHCICSMCAAAHQLPEAWPHELLHGVRRVQAAIAAA